MESEGLLVDEPQFPGRQGRLTFAYGILALIEHRHGDAALPRADR